MPTTTSSRALLLPRRRQRQTVTIEPCASQGGTAPSRAIDREETILLARSEGMAQPTESTAAGETAAAKKIQSFWRRSRVRKSLTAVVELLTPRFISTSTSMLDRGVHGAKQMAKASLQRELRKQLHNYYVKPERGLKSTLTAVDFPWLIRLSLHDFVDGIWQNLTEEMLRLLDATELDNPTKAKAAGAAVSADAAAEPATFRLSAVMSREGSQALPLGGESDAGVPTNGAVGGLLAFGGAALRAVAWLLWPVLSCLRFVLAWRYAQRFLFWLRMDLTRATIHVELKSAEDLLNVDGNSVFSVDFMRFETDVSDPYAIVRLGRMHRTSRTEKNSLNPQWDETFEFKNVRLHDCDKQPLRIDVYDFDVTNADDEIGTAIDSHRLIGQLCLETQATGNPSAHRELSMPLSMQGCVHLAVTVSDVDVPDWGDWALMKLDPLLSPARLMAREVRELWAGLCSIVESLHKSIGRLRQKRTDVKLRVRVLQANDLLNTDGSALDFLRPKDVSDPYVVVSVGGVEARRTPTIADDLNPVWDEGNEFKYDAEPHTRCPQIQVHSAPGAPLDVAALRVPQVRGHAARAAQAAARGARLRRGRLVARRRLSRRRRDRRHPDQGARARARRRHRRARAGEQDAREQVPARAVDARLGDHRGGRRARAHADRLRPPADGLVYRLDGDAAAAAPQGARVDALPPRAVRPRPLRQDAQLEGHATHLHRLVDQPVRARGLLHALSARHLGRARRVPPPEPRTLLD